MLFDHQHWLGYVLTGLTLHLNIQADTTTLCGIMQGSKIAVDSLGH